MFLNDFNEWDENYGVNVKLKDVYIDEHLPHFVWRNNRKTSKNMDELISKYIVKKKRNEMLLILGQPGIGKSTLITWITIKYKQNIEDLLVYQFAADLKNVNWYSQDISENILEILNLSSNELSDKTLILDGFDEISIGYFV
ncbi:hypothetical protein C823_000114 [Eubacterium plexicaudatum ASF492]|nr:hypothetical protein C823_000114 [Eubacterium plexicaudatum ASF492]